jgi:hypothetical protein
MKKVKIITLFTLCSLLLISTVNAQWIKSSGKIVSEKRSVEKFESIKAACSADVFITQGKSMEVIVETDENLLPHIKTEVHDGVLVIDNNKSYKNIKVLKVHITVANLENIFVSGSGDIRFVNTFKTNELNIKINGSGDVNAKLDVKSLEYKISGSGDGNISGVNGKLKVLVSGSGDLNIKDLRLTDCNVKVNGSGDIDILGSTDNLVIAVNGSGDIDAYGLQAVSVNASALGSGNIQVNVIESINAQLRGSGDIYYKGNPDKVNVSSTGSGELYKQN